MENMENMEDFEQIPKIAILNANGDVERTLLCDKYKRPIPPEFSNINPQYVDLMIYPDDAIHTIKMKILRELGILSYSEIYLFGIVEKRIDLKTVFDSVLERATDVTIPAEIFGQLLITLGVDPERIDDIPQKKDYSYEDLLFTDLHMKNAGITIPIGKQFVKPDYLFSANPYYVMAEGRYRHIENNPLISFENHILLNYGTLKSNTIYVCLAESVFEHARANGLPEDVFPELYFPMLFKKNIYGSDTLLEKRKVLLRETAAMNTKLENMEGEAIDLLYDIFVERKGEMPYIENGITDFTCMIHPDKEIALPLEVIFKNIHSSRTVPFIKYNPGARREKIYRLYSEGITKTGSRIPFLDKNIIMILSKTMAKTHEISFYLPLDTTEYGGAKIDIFIHLYANADIRVILKTAEMPLSVGILENLIKTNTNSIIGQINDFLFRSSFQLREFDGIRNYNVEVLDIKYKMALNITKNINVKEQWNLLQFLFDTPTNETLEDGIHMRYTRVENYVKMNDESSHIAELFKQTENEREIIRSLMDKFQMTEEQAILRIARFFDEFTKIEGHFINKNIDIVDNPGFPIEFRIVERIDNKLEIKIDNIIDIQYIECIFRHIDSILRITQDPMSTGVKVARIRKLQTKKMKSPEKEGEKKREVFENVITTKKISQPLNFRNKTTEEDYDIFFQNAVEVEGEEEGEGEGLDEEEEEKEEDEEGEEEGHIEELSKGEPRVEEKEGNDSIGQIAEIKESRVIEEKDLEEDLEDDIFFQNAIDQDEDSDEGSRSTGSRSTGSRSTNSSRGGTSQNSLHLKKGGVSQNSLHLKKGGVSPEEEANIEPYVLEQYKAKLDGMPLKTKNSNLFLNRLTTREPTLFISNPTGKFKSYSRMCPSNIHRQPVILTQAEKDRIDREFPGSYKHSISYGTNPKFHYICPRYWCLLTQRPMTEEEVQESIRKEQANPGSSACGLVLPPGETKVRKGHYIYHFDEEGKQHRDKDGNYVENVPNFLDTDAHPDGKCIPCCFKKQWESKGQIERREQCNQDALLDIPAAITRQGSQIIPPKKDKYILGIEKLVLTQNRWGFLPISAQGFLQTDYADAIDPNNPAFIKEDAAPPLLRFGIEQNSAQSFVGVLADLYKIEKKLEKVPSIREMCTRIIPDAITLDAFIQYHNGSLVGTFRKPVLEESDETIYKKPKYESSNFIKSIDFGEESQVDFLIYTVAAFENFIQFLRNSASTIDHIFLWDIVSTNRYGIIVKSDLLNITSMFYRR